MTLVCETAGLLTTVQDGGRPTAVALGVPRGGACDLQSLHVANLLVDNDPDEAALEITLLGPDLLALETCVIGLAGSDLGAHVPEEDRPLEPGTAHLVHGGTHIRFAEPRDGARAYLAVAGGVDVPEVLGSRGTCLGGRFGGFEGRPLRPGDVVRPRRGPDPSPAGRRWPEYARSGAAGDPIRLLRAPTVLGRPAPTGYASLLANGWTVDEQADRMGLRLRGPAIPVDPRASGELISRPALPGAVQLLPSGLPIVLLADAQTVGGYPVIGVVAQVDQPAMGQLRPGDTVRFAAATLDEATIARASQVAAFAAAARATRSWDAWGYLASGAG
ncbi:MAG TPA: biotin-dependent carboxyltransferase family protein [Candidatus Sulfotelmatobacter sp.]|nr:biotin-dependent carboxyltransferase family protein [Candidatus Sulfotelmatobacter sp.]